MTRGFLKAGHLPTLIAAFLYFDVSFMVWVVLGPLAPYIAEDLGLSATQKGVLIATPLLAGSFFRPILGTLADTIGGRRTGLIGLCLTMIPLLLGWQAGNSITALFVTAALLGIAGASFAVALPLASRWYPPQYQGLAMGIAGAGNSGTLLATLFAPRLAQSWGWHGTMALAALPVAMILALFWFIAKDAPVERAATGLRAYKALFAERDTLWFCFLYSITFGGFVGLASFLTLFFHDQYGLAKVQAGDFTTVAVLCGSFLRPVGGWLSDRLGGYRLLVSVLVVATAAIFGVSSLPSVTVALALFGLTMAMLGMGNGAVFQLVPQRFPGSVGAITGLVGAAGGLGGFFLPSVFGVLKDLTGTYATGLAAFGVFLVSGSLSLMLLGTRWNREWPHALRLRAGLVRSRSFSTSAGLVESE